LNEVDFFKGFERRRFDYVDYGDDLKRLEEMDEVRSGGR
jgi:hypothetical protein